MGGNLGLNKGTEYNEADRGCKSNQGALGYCEYSLTVKEEITRNKIRNKLLSQEELEISDIMFLIGLLKDKKIQKLEEPELEAIQTRIEHNYPMQSLLDLENGDVIYDFVLEGIKEANDIYSMEFVDEVIRIFESGLLEDTECVTVWSDYKNTLIKEDNDSPNNTCGDFNEKIDLAFKTAWAKKVAKQGKQEKMEDKAPANPLKCFFGEMKIEGVETQRDLVYLIAKFKQAISKKAAKQSGKEFVELKGIPDLLEEFKSKYGNTEHLEIKQDNQTGENGDNPVGEIRGDFYYQFFWYQDETGQYRKREEKVCLFTGAGDISIEIINFLRKGEFSTNTQFARDLQQIINSYILNCKFIMPSKKDYEQLYDGVVISEEERNKFKAIIDWFDNFENLSSSIEEEVSISVSRILDSGEEEQKENFSRRDLFEELEGLVLYNYKGFLDKKAFLHETERKRGTIAFVDIKSMWGENVLDFMNTANYYFLEGEKLKEQMEQAEQQGNTTKARRLRREKEKLEENVLLHSGDRVTKSLLMALQQIQEAITKIGKNSKVGLGGDEIYIFVENGDTSTEEELLEKHNLINQIIKQKLAKSQLSGRIQMTEINKSSANEVGKKLNQLDKASMFSKAIEKRLESLKKMLGTKVLSQKEDNEGGGNTNVSIEDQKEFVEKLKDFRFIVKPRLPDYSSENLDFLGEEDCQYDIIFNEIRLPFNGKLLEQFSTEEVFNVFEGEKPGEYRIELKPDGPLVKAFDIFNLGRTAGRE